VVFLGECRETTSHLACAPQTVIHFPTDAAILVVFLLPLPSRFEGDAGVRISEASAQNPSNAIIQNCFTTVCSDVRQLETDGANVYLALHGLPATDTSVVYKYRRSDLRSGVRGAMFNILLGIILKPASQRTRHEQNLYKWLQGSVQQNEIADYSLALDQFNSWQSDPCHFTLDADIASQYEISYSGTPFCFGGGSLSGLFASPPVPAESYFTAYGLKYSYGKPAATPIKMAMVTIAAGPAAATIADGSAPKAAVEAVTPSCTLKVTPVSTVTRTAVPVASPAAAAIPQQRYCRVYRPISWLVHGQSQPGQHRPGRHLTNRPLFFARWHAQLS